MVVCIVAQCRKISRNWFHIKLRSYGLVTTVQLYCRWPVGPPPSSPRSVWCASPLPASTSSWPRSRRRTCASCTRTRSTRYETPFFLLSPISVFHTYQISTISYTLQSPWFKVIRYDWSIVNMVWQTEMEKVYDFPVSTSNTNKTWYNTNYAMIARNSTGWP